MAGKIKCPYTYPHRSREAKVAYICGIGGYSRSRDGRWPIEFNVSAHSTDFSFEHIWEMYVADEWRTGKGRTPEECAAYYRLAKRLHAEHEQHMWEWGQDDAIRNLKDCDTYYMLWDGRPVELEFELRGRCGKHLVLTRFRSLQLEGLDEDDLSAALMEQCDDFGSSVCDKPKLLHGHEWVYSAEFVDILYKYVRQCEVDFTPEKASAEVEYMGAYCFFANIVDSAWEEEKKNMAEHDEVVAAAKFVRDSYICLSSNLPDMKASLAVLFKAAGVSEEELNG